MTFFKMFDCFRGLANKVIIKSDVKVRAAPRRCMYSNFNDAGNDCIINSLILAKPRKE